MKRRIDKQHRYREIKKIIAEREIETQQMLTEALGEKNIAVTQATVSRDIKQLGLVKVPAENGRSRYAAPRDGAERPPKNRLEKLFAEAITNVSSSENIVVVKTMPGTANAIGAALDYVAWPEIIGTLAGDDTVLVIVKPKETAAGCVQKITALWGGKK